MSPRIIYKPLLQALGLLLAASLLFMLAEPALSLAGTTAQNTFTISQVVTKEVSFSTLGSNVTLSPSLGGLTGGTSNGQTQVIILTNDHLGYNMTITASSSVGMIGNASSTNDIPAYVPGADGNGSTYVPDYAFAVNANKAAFGYTVQASSSVDADPHFKNNGAACDAGSTNDGTHCWLNASTTAVQVIDTSFQTPGSGSTSSIIFRVEIQPNPSPTIPDDTYVATTTLTATVN